jgi:hypothetical protein
MSCAEKGLHPGFLQDEKSAASSQSFQETTGEGTVVVSTVGNFTIEPEQGKRQEWPASGL